MLITLDGQVLMPRNHYIFECHVCGVNFHRVLRGASSARCPNCSSRDIGLHPDGEKEKEQLKCKLVARVTEIFAKIWPTDMSDSFSMESVIKRTRQIPVRSIRSFLNMDEAELKDYILANMDRFYEERKHPVFI